MGSSTWQALQINNKFYMLARSHGQTQSCLSRAVVSYDGLKHLAIANEKKHQRWTQACLSCADVSSAGYKYLSSRMKEQEDPDAEQKAQDAFMLQLDELESQLGKHTGPYLVGYVASNFSVMLHSCAE